MGNVTQEEILEYNRELINVRLRLGKRRLRNRDNTGTCVCRVGDSCKHKGLAVITASDDKCRRCSWFTNDKMMIGGIGNGR